MHVLSVYNILVPALPCIGTQLDVLKSTNLFFEWKITIVMTICFRLSVYINVVSFDLSNKP